MQTIDLTFIATLGTTVNFMRQKITIVEKEAKVKKRCFWSLQLLQRQAKKGFY